MNAKAPRSDKRTINGHERTIDAIGQFVELLARLIARKHLRSQSQEKAKADNPNGGG